MKERIKIGIFIDTFFPMVDGVVMVVDNYAKRLSKFADVVVFCPKPNDKSYVDEFDYSVVRSKRIKFFSYDYNLGVPSLDKKFMKELENSNLDIVHIHSPFELGKIGVKYAKKHHIPCVATLHSQYKQDFYKATHSKFLTKILLHNAMKTFNACDICWAVNSEIRDLYINDYKVKSHVIVHNNGTDLKLIENVDESNAIINEKFNISEKQPVFLFVGRIIALKNVFLILDALKIVKANGVDFKMLYVGTGPDLDELNERIKKANLQDNIICCGKITERDTLTGIYRRADLFLFPSLYDASSLVQIEAASQKTPSLFVYGAKTAGTVTEDVNGFFSENTPKAYANKICEIINNKDYYNTVMEGAYRDLYVSWDDAVNSAYEEYKKLIEKQK